jgi:hypothetical protein
LYDRSTVAATQEVCQSSEIRAHDGAESACRDLPRLHVLRSVLAFGASAGAGRFRAMTVLELLVDEKFFDGCYFFLH